MTNYFKIQCFFTFAFLFLCSVLQAQSTVYISGTANSYSVIEGDTYSFNINLYSVSSTPIVVDVSITSGTADATDYTPITTTVTIPAGQLFLSTPLNLITNNDAIIEPNENFIIQADITSGNTTNTSTNRYIQIIDNDTPPTVSASSNTSITEGNSRFINYGLSNPYSSDIILNIATSNGSADNSDYNTVNTTVTFVAGETSKSQSFLAIDDTLVETDETFIITGSITSGNTNNATVVTTATIRDNDTTPMLSIGTPYDRTEGQNVVFSGRLDRVFNADVTIQFTTSNGTAGTSDYNTTTIVETIPAGNISKTITVPTIDDNLDEPQETFTLTGIVTSGNTTNASASATATIVDNDGLPDFRISYSSNFQGEINEGEDARFSVSLTHVSSTDTSIQLLTTAGTAGSLDYLALNTTIVIPAGQTYYNATNLIVPTVLDQLQEADETFVVNAVATSGNTFNTSESLVFTILDDYNVNAHSDTFYPVMEVGGSFQVLTNDTLHGLALNALDVTITLEANTIGATLDASGILTIPNTVSGYQNQLEYTICETANPSICDTATIYIYIVSPLEIKYTPTYSDYNGDGFTSVGDIITYQFSVTNNGNTPITIIDSDNQYSNLNVIGGPIASLAPAQTDSVTFSATHIITQNEINSGYFTGELIEHFFTGMYYGYEVYGLVELETPLSLSFSDGIEFNAFVDTNTNGIQDNAEIDFPLGHFEYEINNDGVIHNLLTTPFYLYESNPTTSYNLNYVVDSEYAGNNVCTVNYSGVTVASGSGITTYNFPVTVTPYEDLSVSLNNYNAPPRPGFSYINYITYTNNSNQTVTSGTVDFVLDSDLSILEASDGAVITSTGLTYAFTNLEPYQTRYIWIKMNVPTIPTVALGDLVNNSASINVPTGDILPLNNTSSLIQTIIGAYDPNIKTEKHDGQIVHSTFTDDDFLTYTIQFENTGTANAINVKVEDFLDDKLDETTLRMVDASATYALERVNNHLIWNFYGINLPPSVEDTDIGHGYFTFKIKPKTGYLLGDIIPNVAEIYFDFNPAIITDVCNTEFVETLLSVDDFTFSDFNYYPNPVKNTLFISNTSKIETIEITDILGKVVSSKKMNAMQTTLDLSSFANGVYFAKIESGRQTKTIKILKE
ncbi:DUF7619 domain-containing protein [Lacinutrix mariniflava]|uniref:DUF7619 domain-containing protein n=1 Tax=Lacinutrix mariniflava TaxID=342955 RepID=UPI0006E3EBF4|nr:Calx-beta domain-containing protein [Lacinutrix mariniflava]